MESSTKTDPTKGENVMQYMGGKGRYGSRIAEHVQRIIDAQSITTYIEPFCGALGVMRHIKAPTRIGYDANAYMIRLWTALQEGWIPPTVITEAQYAELRSRMVYHPATAFAAIGCSFGAKWWGGYARNKDNHNYAASASRGLLKILPSVRDVIFDAADYRDIQLPSSPCMIYCDPPYRGTTAYAALRATQRQFDSDAFFEWSRARISDGHHLLISEYSVPEDFVIVEEFAQPNKGGLRTNTEKQTDKLWCHTSQRKL